MPRVTENGKYECRGCRKEYVKHQRFWDHTHSCKSNRDAYLKILALELDPEDTQVQEDLGIRYEYVLNPKLLNENEMEVVTEMRRQANKWGSIHLTPEVVQNLGNWSDGEILRVLNTKRKRTPAEDDLDVSNLAPLPNPNASIASHRTYHAPSPPPLEDLLASPSFTNTVNYPPALNITHPQVHAQDQTSDTVNHSIPQQSLEIEDSVYLGDFTSSFDLAFAKWLDEENISKAAIGRLFKDPAMQPITSKLSWKSVSKMKNRLESVKFHEDSE
ncbi:hypothetical protein KCU85_g3443, partial [Aureobasidium melanogenum]